MKFMLSGGGTAGHINPAIAIAEILAKAYPNAEILFVGTPHGMERRLVTEAGYRMRTVEVEGLRRSFTLKNLGVIRKAVSARRTAVRMLREERPDLVVGTGGYVCYPLLRAAAGIGIPTLLHESNASPGLTVRLLAGSVDTVLLNFPSAEKLLPRSCSCVTVGNPLRTDFAGLEKGEARRRLGIPPSAFYLLSFGGSLGAASINAAMLKAIPNLRKTRPDLRVLHATGRDRFDAFLKEFDSYSEAESRFVKIAPYITEMALHMTACDAMICRSGAMTISEAAYTATPTILIPFPGAADDHQTKNARALADCGAAILIPDAEVSADRLEGEIDRLIRDPHLRKSMEQAISRFARRDVSERILHEVDRLLYPSTKVDSATD